MRRLQDRNHAEAAYVEICSQVELDRGSVPADAGFSCTKNFDKWPGLT